MIPYLPQPVLTIGPLTIHAFGFCTAAALLTGYFLVNRRAERFGVNRDFAFRVYVIRGMIPGNGLATRATVSTFVDGALVFGGNISNLADVDHVETVKGPQSAYFGRGSFAGAIYFASLDACRAVSIPG